MTSYFQTAELRLVAAPFPIDTYRMRPLMPISAKKKFAEEYNVKLTREDGVIFIWYLDGFVVEILPNGDTTTFAPKPTLESALKLAPCGQFTQFHKDGAVSGSNGCATLHWSAPVSAQEENGEIFFDHWCDQQLVWDDACEGKCGYESDCYDDGDSYGEFTAEKCRCCGLYEVEKSYPFCSRSCLTAYFDE